MITNRPALLNRNQESQTSFPQTNPNEFDQPSAEMSVRWITSAEELEALRPQWDRLSEVSLRKNLTFNHNYLVPAMRHLGNGKVKLLVVESTVLEQPDQKVLCGLMPISESSLFGLPLRSMAIWKHVHAFDSTPLLRRDCALEALVMALKAVREAGGKFLEIDTFGADSGVAEVLAAAIKELGWGCFRRNRFERAAFRPSRSHDEYMKTCVSKGTRKKYQRLVRRVEELGQFEVEISNVDSDFDALAQSFLDLEARGWKGAAGTALNCSEHEQAFFQEMVRQSSQLGRVSFLSLMLDGKPIAMLCDLYDGNHGAAFKTAFDEDFGSYSPGILAEIKNIEYLHHAGVTSMDSCTAPDNQAINRILKDRLAFESGVVGLGAGLALPHLVTRVLPWGQSAARSVKGLMNFN